MRVTYPLQNAERPGEPSVVAIGIFDGVHRGHQQILRQTIREASSQNLVPVVLTFDTHASELLHPERRPSYINSLSQRVNLLDRMGGGLGEVAIARFDRDFAALSPSDFIRNVLLGMLSVRHILVGADFRYGHNREGRVSTLLRSGAEDNFAVTVVPPILEGNNRISSTQIRQLIHDGDVMSAVELLGHEYAVRGQVVLGKRLGTTIGYPTANVMPEREGQQLPSNGVYAGTITLQSAEAFRCAVSVGTNPTTDHDGVKKIEAFIMDGFSRDIYGQTVDLAFAKKIRDEKKFSSLKDLTDNIAVDVRMIDALLG